MIARGFKIVVNVSAVAVAGLTVLFLFAVVRLAMGPISLDFLTPHIESGLNDEDGDFRVGIGGTVLAWSRAEQDIDILAKDVRVTTREGAEQAFVPEVAIGLSVRAFLRGEFRPTRFSLVGPRIRLVRDRDGHFTFGDPAPTQPAASDSGSEPPAVAAPSLSLGGGVTGKVLGTLLERPPDDHPLRYLTTVKVREADLEFDDRRHGIRVHAPGTDFALTRDRGGLGGNAQVSLRLGGRTTPIELTGQYFPGTRKIALAADFRGLVPASLAQLAEAFEPLAVAELPADGTVSVQMDAEGQIEQVVVEARARPGRLVAAKAFAAPVKVRGMALKARLDNLAGRLDLDYLRADLGGPRISLSGRAQREGESTRVALDVTARNVTVPDIKRLWPKGFASGGRAWVFENIVEGAVARADTHLGLTVPAGAGAELEKIDIASVEGRFGFKGLALHFLKPLPAVTGINGRATVGPGEMTFEATTGRLEGLRVDEAKVRLYGLDKDKTQQFMEAEVVTRGKLPAVLALLDHPRLDLLKGFGLDIGGVRGEMATRLAVKVPLLNDVTIEGIDITAASNLRGVRIPKVAFDSDLTDGDLILRLDKRGMDVSGNVRLADIPAQFAWTENFLSGARYRGRYGLKGRIDEAGQKRLGLSAAPYVSGPMGFDLVLTRYADQRSEVFATLDLGDAALTVEEIEWSKAPGVPGIARFFLGLQGERVREIRNLSVTAGDLEARGSVRLAEDGKTVESFDFGKLAFGESDIRVSGGANPGGGLKVSIAGPRLDIQPFLEARREEGPKLPLDVAVDVGAVRVGKGPPIAAVRGTLARGTGDWQNMDIRGRVGDEAKPVRITIAPQGGARSIRIVSDDAGATLKTFDVTENMVGGRLRISGRFDDAKPSAPLTGKLTVKDFSMVRAPLMAKLLGVMSLTGVLDALTGKGLGFTTAEVPFTKTGDLLVLGESRAYGSAVGFTAKGWIDIEKNRLDLEGTVVPAYMLNSVFGRIPLIGPIFAPEKGSGLFAATYRMQGSIDDPQISHNPLATLTPGFLRGLFDIFEEPVSKPPASDGAPAPENAPPPPAPPTGPEFPPPSAE